MFYALRESVSYPSYSGVTLYGYFGQFLLHNAGECGKLTLKLVVSIKISLNRRPWHRGLNSKVKRSLVFDYIK